MVHSKKGDDNFQNIPFSINRLMLSRENKKKLIVLKMYKWVFFFAKKVIT
jgi:hypothetical protein